MTDLPSLDGALLDLLKKGKNLLAFSAGVDSSALFFLLEFHGVPFDCALVDYGVREASKEEKAHAEMLCRDRGKRFFTTEVILPASHFEEEARKVRYAFFEKVIQKEGYDRLITAHQMNDQAEWLLMQLTKGAGAAELVGMESISEYHGYTVVRPLLTVSRNRLKQFLEKNRLPFFEDVSNGDPRFLRNRFRQVVTPLMESYENGIRRSLTYLERDARLLRGEGKIGRWRDCAVIPLPPSLTALRQVDRELKRRGYLLSGDQREAIEQKWDVVIAGVFAVAATENSVWIAPYVETVMEKSTRERFRTGGVPPKIRGYLYSEAMGAMDLSELLDSLTV